MVLNVPASFVGQPNGVASLDSTGKVPSSQLPSMNYIPTSVTGSPNVVPTLYGNSRVVQDADNALNLKVGGTSYSGSQSAAPNIVPVTDPNGVDTSNAFAATGLTGATPFSRYVGATLGGPPSSGTFQKGDWVLDIVNWIVWICTAAGTPGTWTQIKAAAVSPQGYSLLQALSSGYEVQSGSVSYTPSSTGVHTLGTTTFPMALTSIR